MKRFFQVMAKKYFGFFAGSDGCEFGGGNMASRWRAAWRVFSTLVVLIAMFFVTFGGLAQTNGPAVDDNQTAKEKEGCTRNLKLIYEAIQAYQADHKELPNWLSDLVPQYLTDASVLICPVCQRTGETETSKLADPKLPCSYVYQFAPVALGSELPDDPTRTRREWKRRQMGLVGAVVPLVRCSHHGGYLNLSFEGQIYESGSSWEALLTNKVNVDDLSPTQLFAHDTPLASATKSTNALMFSFPARDTQAKAGQVDLTAYYNAVLTNSWIGGSNDDLTSLPTFLEFNGVDYDARGVIQLACKKDSMKVFPRQLKGIKIGQKAKRLHFLHATAFARLKDDEGLEVGDYVVHYTTSAMVVDVPIYYGRDVRDWHMRPGERPKQKELTVAWTGANEAGIKAGYSLRLFTTTWTNVAADVEIDSIDFISAMGAPAPFLVAVTAD